MLQSNMFTTVADHAASAGFLVQLIPLCIETEVAGG